MEAASRSAKAGETRACGVRCGAFMRLPTFSALTDASSPRDALLRVAETLVVAASAFITRFWLDDGVAPPATESAAAAFAVLLAWSAMFASTGQRAQSRFSWLRDVIRPALHWIALEAVAAGAVHLMFPTFGISWTRLGCWCALSAIGVIVCRLIWRAIRARDARTRSVAIVGSARHCALIERSIESTRDSVFRIDAHFETDLDSQPSADTLARFRDIDRFASHVRAEGIDELWLTLPLTHQLTLQRFLDLFRKDLIDIRLIPDLAGLARFHGDKPGYESTFAINLVALRLTARARALKSAFDRVFAAAAIVAFAPLLLAITVAVKLSSPGPVLFRQLRRGANGRPFQIYKFRTMHVHAADEGVIVQATQGDARITRVGAFLRRTSLDELPQFFNVLRGDMSVVGPRPHAIEHDALYQDIVDDYIHRYRIKPGITGWAQVNGLRGETDSIDKMQRRVEHDLYYLSNWSFALDLRIVCATVVRGFVHHNAY
jgi:Undecaprenyl-phosphate glucose phosphotransferase